MKYDSSVVLLLLIGLSFSMLEEAIIYKSNQWSIYHPPGWTTPYKDTYYTVKSTLPKFENVIKTKVMTIGRYYRLNKTDTCLLYLLKLHPRKISKLRISEELIKLLRIKSGESKYKQCGSFGFSETDMYMMEINSDFDKYATNLLSGDIVFVHLCNKRLNVSILRDSDETEWVNVFINSKIYCQILNKFTETFF